MKASVIGAGLAGCEAALWLAGSRKQPASWMMVRLCWGSSAAGCFGGYGSVSVHSLQDSSENCGSFVPA